MKISLEFNDLRDLLLQMPKFALLIAGNEPYEQRMAQAIEPDPQVLKIQLKPEDGSPITANEKEALRRILVEFAKDPEAFTSDPDTVTERVVNGLKADGVFPEKAPWAEEAKAAPAEPDPAPAEAPKKAAAKKSAQKATAAAESPEEAQASENTPEKEKPAQSSTGAATKASDADVRAAFNKLMKNDRRDAVVKILKSFGAKNFSGLAAENYKAAIDLADAYGDMSEDEYKEALKG